MVESISELKKICQKHANLYSFSKDAKTPVPKFFYHRFLDFLAIYVVKPLLYTNITANQITIISMILGVFAGFLFANPNPLHWIGGFFLLQFIFVLDGVDGCIARYRKTANPIGKLFDVIAPAIIIPATFAGMAYGVYYAHGNFIALLLGFVIITFFLAAALLNATRKYLLYGFAFKLKDPGVFRAFYPSNPDAITSQKLPIRYVIKKLLSFQGLSFIILLVTIIDLYLEPVTISQSILNIPNLTNVLTTLSPITARFLLLCVLAITTIIVFIKRLRYAASLQDKAMKYL